MLLNTVRTDEDGNLLACPHCDNEELVQGEYCMICGVKLEKAVKEMHGEESGNAIQVHQGE